MPRSTLGHADAAHREAVTPMRALAAFSRAAGAAPVTGNSIRLRRDARENSPAWLEAIAGAPRTVHAYPLAAIGTWVAGALLYRGYHLRRRAKPERAPSGGPP